MNRAVQEVNYAVDNLCHTFGFVVAGIDERVHPGRCSAYPPGHRHHCRTDPDFPGKKSLMTMLTIKRTIKRVR